ncbi:MAG: hypothetical protein V7688_10305 [Alcanivorax jadensis]|uniref:hypothetical protein n=1 Tax=Alcanivorax jadensis TaxID=64988 RepID=UPI0030014F5B
MTIFALADMYVRQRKADDGFRQFQYVAKEIDIRASVLLAEHVLEMAIKLRFLDDRRKLIEENDRNQIHVDTYREGAKGVLRGVRWALNKLMHQTDIDFSVREQGTVVLSSPETKRDNAIYIPSGLHKDRVVMVLVKGKQNGRSWDYQFSLAELLNEVLRVLFLSKNNL